MSEEKKSAVSEETAKESRDLTEEELTQVTGGSGLSGGQRQRVALARAIADIPKALLLYEADSGTDIKQD